jgi:hypothetical protein
MAHTVNPHTVNYSVIRGLSWERHIYVKNRRTRRVVKVTEPDAFIRISDTHKKQIDASVLSDNGIKLYLDAGETVDLVDGSYVYDVWAYVGTTDKKYLPVARGTIDVSTYDNVTPLEDTDAMELRTKERVDFRQTFTWKDEDGDVLAIQNAYMQAEDSSGNIVLDLRWYASAPSEATIIALPETRRGYIAPSTGATLELHISNKNPIAAGSYSFDLFVQDTLGDWDSLITGKLVVEPSISVEPA